MDHQISKALFRKTVLQYRKLLSADIHAALNGRLLRRVSSFLDDHLPETIHAFLAIRRNAEPDIKPLFPELHNKGIRIMISRTDFQHKTMSHFYLNEEVRLIENHLGIPEPTGNICQANIAEADIIFVPLLVADRKGYRIGYGGGYYDRLLQETKALKVGLSLSPPVDELCQREEWDQKLNYLLTPYNIYPF